VVAHDHEQNGNGEHDADEQRTLAKQIGESLTESFVSFIDGELEYADLSFEVFQALQDLYVIKSGEYELEYLDGDHEHDDEE
jgi:hypothetical protein